MSRYYHIALLDARIISFSNLYIILIYAILQVSEVKQSEEREKVRMNIYDMGMELINRLYLRLIEDKWYEDVERAARDDEYREQLFQEYGIDN